MKPRWIQKRVHAKNTIRPKSPIITAPTRKCIECMEPWHYEPEWPKLPTGGNEAVTAGRRGRVRDVHSVGRGRGSGGRCHGGQWKYNYRQAFISVFSFQINGDLASILNVRWFICSGPSKNMTKNCLTTRWDGRGQRNCTCGLRCKHGDKMK